MSTMTTTAKPGPNQTKAHNEQIRRQIAELDKRYQAGEISKNQYETEKKRLQKQLKGGIGTGGLIIIAIGGLALGGFLWYEFLRKKPKTTTTPTGITLPQPSQSASPFQSYPTYYNPYTNPSNTTPTPIIYTPSGGSGVTPTPVSTSGGGGASLGGGGGTTSTTPSSQSSQQSSQQTSQIQAAISQFESAYQAGTGQSLTSTATGLLYQAGVNAQGQVQIYPPGGINTNPAGVLQSTAYIGETSTSPAAFANIVGAVNPKTGGSAVSSSIPGTGYGGLTPAQLNAPRVVTEVVPQVSIKQAINQGYTIPTIQQAASSVYGFVSNPIGSLIPPVQASSTPSLSVATSPITPTLYQTPTFTPQSAPAANPGSLGVHAF
jgi:hypothetical protein